MKTTLTTGGTIDADAIARGLYAMFDDESRTVLKFGMLPAKFMTPLERMLGEKAENLAKDQCEKAFGFRPEGDVADAKFKTEFVRESMRAVTLALYKVAPMVV